MTVPRDIRQIILPNALHLVCREDSHRYFGDYHLVRVLMSVAVPLEPRFFDDEDECRAARKLLPDPVVYRRVAERMGVSSSNVDAVRTALVDDLLRHAGGYLGSAQFPRKFIRSELARIRFGRGSHRSVPVMRGA
jgi:hypothetical protein